MDSVHSSSRASRLVARLYTFVYAPLTAALPISRTSESGPFASIDTGQDAWAEALSGVGPLILLIGEKNTKQLLREARGLPAILSMSFAPIGLLSVLTSMIRLCGSQKLRSYLGYEHEPRANAALEMTKANCGGIHAEVVDGFISRSTASDASSQALAVAFLQGDSELAIQESLAQIRLCYEFQTEKGAKGCPENTGNVHWCFRITCPTIKNATAFNKIAEIVSSALGINNTSNIGDLFRIPEPPICGGVPPAKNDASSSAATTNPRPNKLEALSDCEAGKAPELEDRRTPPAQSFSGISGSPQRSLSEKRNTEHTSIPEPPNSEPTQIASRQKAQVDLRDKGATRQAGLTLDATTVPTPPNLPSPANIELVSRRLDNIMSASIGLPKPIKSSFFCTFDGVSELSASSPTPTILSITVAVTSFLSMIAIQVICLWQENWFSGGIIMAFVGYICMVIGVSAAGYLIYSACNSTTMLTRPRTQAAEWIHGLVMLVKNTDSLDTNGSRLMQAEGREHVFEAVWLRKQGGWRFLLAWLISIFLTLAFICYYLGLRSCRWWLSVAQLLICLTAAFARSVNKMDRNSFEVVEDIRLDKRCYSTGILDMQRASRISQDQRTSEVLDIRIYSIQSSQCLPLTGEFVAWQAAKLCLQSEYQSTGNKVLSVTGMKLSVIPTTDPLKRKVVVLFKGGVVTTEGLAFPNATMCIAFPSSTTDLAAPTPLLARGVMRQHEWSVEQTEINKETLPFMGGTYVSTFDSLVTWWTIAEDRNDMGDQHKNLHGSFVLINIAFFLSLLRGDSQDDDLIHAIEVSHQASSKEDETYAKDLVSLLKRSL